MYGQACINALVSASSYALTGVSFYLTFSIARFVHFTHGAFLALGAFITYVLMTEGEMSLIPASVTTLLLVALLSSMLDWGVFRPIRKSGSNPFIPLLASLGLYTLIQNTLSMLFGDSALAFPGSRDWDVYDVPGGRMTEAQVAQLAAAVVLPFTVWIMMERTPLGQRMRAVGQNIELSKVLGISTDSLVGISFAIGYALAGLTGILAACNVDLTPTMGMKPMMMGMVAMIIGGNTLWGTVCGAVLLGMGQHIGVIWLPTQWQDAIAFLVLIAFLVFRPRGFFGKVDFPG